MSLDLGCLPALLRPTDTIHAGAHDISWFLSLYRARSRQVLAEVLSFRTWTCPHGVVMDLWSIKPIMIYLACDLRCPPALWIILPAIKLSWSCFRWSMEICWNKLCHRSFTSMSTRYANFHHKTIRIRKVVVLYYTPIPKPRGWTSSNISSFGVFFTVNRKKKANDRTQHTCANLWLEIVQLNITNLISYGETCTISYIIMALLDTILLFNTHMINLKKKFSDLISEITATNVSTISWNKQKWWCVNPV